MSYLQHVQVDEVLGLHPEDEPVKGAYTKRVEIVEFIIETPFDPTEDND